MTEQTDAPSRLHTTCTPADRLAAGKALRRRAPRSSHGDWAPMPDRADPLDLLQAQDTGRIAGLLPIKYGRMLESPFAFLRGSAVVMAADLAHTPVTGLESILCGDAHLSNFGVFATPERNLVFDLNDFDEAYPGPWEWDLKRLAASAAVAGRINGFSDTVNRDLAVTAAATYQEAMQYFVRHSTLEMWYYHVDADDVTRLFDEDSSKRGRRTVEKTFKKARRRTQIQTLEKLTELKDGRRRIVSNPPLLVPYRKQQLRNLIDEETLNRLAPETLAHAWEQYLTSLPPERRFLLERYSIVDAALRVGGVGSVGTHCSIALLEGDGPDDAIILQTKEAGPSVLEAYLGPRRYEQHAERVVVGQRLMQASSDIFLGWHQSSLTGSDYYWRQLKDMKGSFDVEELDKASFRTYVSLCSWCLARAHARTGDILGMRGYLGKNDAFATAVGAFAMLYADQTEQDHAALAAAVKSGRISAEQGI